MITDLFGIDLPIVQAPMAGSQGSALAIAVSNAGGLGSQPCAMLAPDGVRHRDLTKPEGSRGIANTKGHIGFLGHGARVEFRNIRIRELRP